MCLIICSFVALFVLTGCQQHDYKAVDPEGVLIPSPASQIIQHPLGPRQALGLVTVSDVSAEHLSPAHPFLPHRLVAVLKAVVLVDEDQLDGKRVQDRIQLFLAQPVDHSFGHVGGLH